MVVDKNRTDHNAFMIGRQCIQEVEDFMYLGSTITNKGTCAPEIRRRLATAREAVRKMGDIWRTRGISVALKVRLLCAMIFPIATYGCESWTILKADRKRVEAFKMWCYGRILRMP